MVTARDTLSLVTARWQEFVKNGAVTPIDGYPVREETAPENEWDWGTLDLADVLSRWGATLPPERVHVLTLPKPGSAPDELWLRFAHLVGVEAGRCVTSQAAQNESLGVVGVELLRRVNAELVDFDSPQDRGNWIRGYLAQEQAGGAPGREVLALAGSRRGAAGAGRAGSPTSWHGRGTTWSATSRTSAPPSSCRRAGTPTRSPTPRWLTSPCRPSR